MYECEKEKRSISFGKEVEGQSFIFDGLTFNVCVGGSAGIRINYCEYRIKAGEIFVVLPKHIFSVLECSPGLEIRTVLVSFDALRYFTSCFDLLSRANVQPCVKLEAEQTEDILKIHSIIGRYDKEGKQFREIRDALALSLLLIVSSMFEQTPSTAEPACTRQESITRIFFDLLLQHFTEERSVAFYANKLCITPKYLAMAVKAVTCHSAQTWINEVVLTEAKRLIKATELSIQQISEQLNFPADSAFVRFFKMHTGSTPLAFRKKDGR